MFGNKGDSSGSDMWHQVWWLHVPRNPLVAGLAEGCGNVPRGAAWTLRSMASGWHCKDFKTLDFLNCWSWKPTARLFKGTSAYALAKKMASLGQYVKKLWTVRSELYFRWERRMLLETWSPKAGRSNLQNANLAAEDLLFNMCTHPFNMCTHPCVDLFASWANKKRPCM